MSCKAIVPKTVQRRLRFYIDQYEKDQLESKPGNLISTNC